MLKLLLANSISELAEYDLDFEARADSFVKIICCCLLSWWCKF